MEVYDTRSYGFPMGNGMPTSGESADCIAIQSSTDNQMLFDDVIRRTVDGVSDEGMRARAIRALRALSSAVNATGIVVKLPRIVTDFRFEEAYYEWMFHHFRIGIVVSPDQSEDGWFLVTDESMGDTERVFDLDDIAEAAMFVRSYYEYGRGSELSVQMRARNQGRGLGRRRSSIRVRVPVRPA